MKEKNCKTKEYKQQLPNESLKGEDPPAWEWRQLVGCCENGVEPALAIKRVNFLTSRKTASQEEVCCMELIV